ncbi:MAG: potassium-transporting ATPase subunit KdpA [Senegalimassilia anaerobia]|nr:potassium-transporting ATPase subunit KdpA [Senegalimassilia anaerobia]
MDAAIQYILYFAVLVVLAVPLGRFMAHIMDGEHTFLSPVIAPVERGVYRLLRIDTAEQMGCRRYLASVLVFSGIGLVALVALQALQSFLPGNPQHLPGVSWDLSFNTAASFITNTNWQSYSGETTLSYFVQFMGLTVQNFVSAGTGIAVMFALIRGFRQVKEQGLGSFWVDLTRTVLYVLIPLNLVFGICLAAGGVISNFQPAQKAELVEPVAVQPNADGGWSVIDGAQIEGDTVKVDGKVVEGARVVTEQFLPQGPAAPQVAIKQSGTNGGGFFGVNSAHPYENPSAFTNIIEMTSLLLIPAACCFTFGIGVKNTKQGKAIFAAMFILLVIFAGIIAVNEHAGTPQLADGGAVNIEMTDGQAGGNMEGKEVRFGVFGTSLFATATTDASCGAVNAMHDSLTPLGGMLVLFNMLLGEIIYGGVGSGLYGMILFILLTVFIAGLMVGRTPDYLGKRIEGREITWCMVALLACATPILCFSAVAAVSSWGTGALNNAGAHGLSEILYAFTSGAQNNGSAFAGLSANVPVWNVLLALAMFIGRFGVMLSMLVVAGSLAARKKRPISDSSFPVEGPTFGLLLLGIIFIVGALTYLPALSLGPIVEQFQMMRGMMF